MKTEKYLTKERIESLRKYLRESSALYEAARADGDCRSNDQVAAWNRHKERTVGK